MNIMGNIISLHRKNPKNDITSPAFTMII